MKKILKITAVLVLVFNMLACGTIMHGSQEEISISAPSKAVVKVDGRTSEGSNVMKLDRNKSYTVSMDKDGKNHICGQIDKSISPGIVVADVLLGFAGLIVDAVTGAWYDLSPNQVTCRSD